MKTSRLPGFYRRPLAERLDTLQGAAALTDDEVATLRDAAGFSHESADCMIENAIGVFPLPLGLGVNFRIDNEDFLIPMAVEEPSVLAAASNAANLLREGAGIITSSTPPIMIGQIQILDFGVLAATRRSLEAAADKLVMKANEVSPRLLERGGGAERLIVRELPHTAIGPMLVAHLEINVCDAMGANIINTMAESISPDIEAITGGRVRLRILSNLADKRLVRAEGRISLARLARGTFRGDEVARGIIEASVMADVDPYRAATHNKGAMNGIDAVLVAAGQDWRAVEAGCHAYAARDGHYRSLSRWAIDGDELIGAIEIPMQVGVVGGITKTHPVVRVVHKILGHPTAARLGEIAAACGLAQNLAAITALATEGIQCGHMRMHARNLAHEVGALAHEINHVVAEMRKTGTYTTAEAQGALGRIRGAM